MKLDLVDSNGGADGLLLFEAELVTNSALRRSPSERAMVMATAQRLGSQQVVVG